MDCNLDGFIWQADEKKTFIFILENSNIDTVTVGSVDGSTEGATEFRHL